MIGFQELWVTRGSVLVLTEVLIVPYNTDITAFLAYCYTEALKEKALIMTHSNGE